MVSKTIPDYEIFRPIAKLVSNKIHYILILAQVFYHSRINT